MIGILSVYLEPLAIVGWLLLVLAVALCTSQTARRVRVLAIGICTFYFVMTAPFPANMVVRLLEDRALDHPCPPPRKGDVIVVLAGGLNGEAQSPREYERMKESTARRALAAIRFAKAAPGSILVTSGGAGGPVREADMMASLAMDMGIEPARVVSERASRSTYESARAVARLLAAQDSRSAVHLVTSALHMPRAVAAFDAATLPVCALPVDFRYVEPRWNEGFVPQLSAAFKSAQAYHEIIGQFAYALNARKLGKTAVSSSDGVLK